jgi:phospholipid/cholesterol/gamma-HCH transport system ATP-binding protein
MTTSDPLIRARGVSVLYGAKHAVEGVDLDLFAGEVFFLLGPSGCGKSTLLKCLIGLILPTEGTILVKGVDVTRLNEEELEPYRRCMGVAFQTGALFNSMTLLENVVLPIVENTELSREEARAVARMKLDMVGLLDAAHKLPSELSGGMRKRGAIARAMALDPDCLFLDEPTSGLDPVTAAEMDDLVMTLNEAFGVTVFAVSHDIGSAFRIATRTAIMSEGRILKVQSPEEMERDEEPMVADFVHRRARGRRSGGGIERYLETGGGRR